jgi:predicted flavoprotein YhiN
MPDPVVAQSKPPASEAGDVDLEPKVKMVPESTVASIRKKYSDDNKKLRESLDSEIQKGLDLQSQVESLTEVQGKYEKLQSEHKSVSEKLYVGELHRQSLLKERVESLRQSVASRGGVKPEVLKDKNYDQLVALDESLTLLGKPQSKDFVTKIAGDKGTPQTKNEALQEMLSDAKSKK